MTNNSHSTREIRLRVVIVKPAFIQEKSSTTDKKIESRTAKEPGKMLHLEESFEWTGKGQNK